MLKRECTMRQYTISIDLLPIMNADEALEDILIFFNPLSEQLDMLNGITDSDYNGHFGNYIFLRIDSKYDNDETWELIEKTINDHIKVKG
jgi:hypothetical protein